MQQDSNSVWSQQSGTTEQAGSTSQSGSNAPYPQFPQTASQALPSEHVNTEGVTPETAAQSDGAPSQPQYPSTFPTSQPVYPYTSPASQPVYPAWYSAGQPIAPSKPGYAPASQPLNPSAPQIASKRKSRKVLWIALASALVLLLTVGGGAGFIVVQISAPAATASQFCTDLKGQDYGAAYGMFSPALQSKYSQTEFGQVASALDQIEGKITACAQAPGGKSYQYSFGATSASVVTTITREKQGVLQGTLRLVNASGAWRVDTLDTALLGINPGALEAVQSFCAAMQSQNYSQAFSSLAGTAQNDWTASGFAANAKLDDQIDGTISTCGITTIAQGNGDTSATVTVTLVRSNAGAKTGTVTLSSSGGMWQITAIAASVRGTDYGAIAAGELFCETVALPMGGHSSADLAYDLLAPDLQQSESKQTFESDWGRSGVQYSCGHPDMSTFQLSGDQASYSASLTLSDSFGDSHTFQLTLDFERNNGVWQVDGYAWN